MSQRVYLLPECGNFYKANLHCHSTVSDGRLTPEEIKEKYKSHGYSIVAFTDHRVVVPHPELDDEDFLTLTGSEFDCNEPDVEWPGTRSYHLNFISKKPDMTEFIPFVRVHSPEGIQKVIDDAAKAGFIAQYNHPRWSMQNVADFGTLRGLYAFEIFNTQGDIELFNGDAEYEYEQYLRAGGRCAVTATDDTHFSEDINLFRGFSFIKAPNLEYDTIIKALENGDMYASNGPEIKNLYIEDNVLHIETTPCCKIGVFTETRASGVVSSKTMEDDITSADIPLNFKREYIRITVVDTKGKRAWTRAYDGV